MLKSLCVLGFGLYQWAVYIPLAITATIVGASIAVPIGWLLSPRIANVYVATLWAKFLTTAAGVRLTVSGREHIDPRRSYVVVANHQSAFDIPVIYGYSGLDLRWVMKAEIKWFPVGGGCRRAIGPHFGVRGKSAECTLGITKAFRRMDSGSGVLFFPEGTRSIDGRLLPFKKGAFRLAVDQQMDILPVTLKGTADIIKPKSVVIHPGTVEMIFHEPIEVAGATISDVPKLLERSRKAIASALGDSNQ